MLYTLVHPQTLLLNNLVQTIFLKVEYQFLCTVCVIVLSFVTACSNSVCLSPPLYLNRICVCLLHYELLYSEQFAQGGRLVHSTCTWTIIFRLPLHSSTQTELRGRGETYQGQLPHLYSDSYQDQIWVERNQETITNDELMYFLNSVNTAQV